MSPCGMVMDLGRRSVRQEAEVGQQVGERKVHVRWYPCAAGAKQFPYPHAFGSSYWEDDPDAWTQGPGIYAPFGVRWSDYDAPPGQHFHGDPDWFLYGLPQSVLLDPPSPGELPECMKPMELQVQDITGVEFNVGYPDTDLIQVDQALRLIVVGGPAPGQVILGWLGGSVGEFGDEPVDGVYTLLFEGATVDVVDATTVKVTVAAAGSLPPFAGRYSQTLHTGPVGDNDPYWGGASHSTSGTTDTVEPEWGFGLIHAYGTDPSSDDLTITLPSVADVLGSGWWAYLWNRNGATDGRLLLVGTGGEELLDRGIVVSECIVDTYHEVVLVLSQAEASPPWIVLRFSPASTGPTTIDGGTF